jgi:hypothetical protein
MSAAGRFSGQRSKVKGQSRPSSVLRCREAAGRFAAFHVTLLLGPLTSRSCVDQNQDTQHFALPALTFDL